MTNIAKPVSVLVVTLALVWGGCGSQPGTPATAIPTAQRTGPPISGHVPLQTPTPLPKPQPPSSLAGVEITALRDGPDEDVPPGYVFFYPALRWEQWPNTLFRTFVDSAGTPHTRDLFSPFAERFPQGSGVYSWAGDATMGEILVSVCPVGVCGQGIRSLSGDGVVRTACHLCDPAADDEGLLFHSVDGGITWTEAGTIPPSDRVAAWGSRGPILAHPSNDPAPAPPYRFRIWPSGEAE